MSSGFSWHSVEGITNDFAQGGVRPTIWQDATPYLAVYIEGQGAEISGERMSFAGKIDLSKYFTPASCDRFDQLRDIYAIKDPDLQKAAITNWLNANATYKKLDPLDKASSMLFNLQFKDGQAFFDYYADMGSRMSEWNRVKSGAFWAGSLGTLYDYTLTLQRRSAQDMIGSFIGSTPVGICGNINGTFLKEFYRVLGIEHASVAIWPGGGLGHVVAFLKGKERYYLVDYGKSFALDSNPDVAKEQVLAYAGQASPFSFSVDRGTFFDQPLSERFLLNSIGWMKPQIEQKMGVSLIYDNSAIGLRLAHPFQEKWADFCVGAFVMDTPFAIGTSFGASFNARLHASGNKPLWGCLRLPTLDFAVVKPVESEGFVMAGLDLISLDLSMGSNFEARFSPIRAEAATEGHGTITGRGSSKLGFVYSKNRLGEIFADAELGYPASGDFYDFGNDRAWRLSAGYSSQDKTAAEAGNDTEVKMSWTPQSIISKVQMDASQRIQLSKPLSLLMFVHAADLDGKSLSGGLQVTYQFGK
ncbi:Uncharacterised protein [uncultured archaeon]|nr:Uncharacterised protein [uncultured archaeon]